MGPLVELSVPIQVRLHVTMNKYMCIDNGGLSVRNCANFSPFGFAVSNLLNWSFANSCEIRGNCGLARDRANSFKRSLKCHGETKL